MPDQMDMVEVKSGEHFVQPSGAYGRFKDRHALDAAAGIAQRIDGKYGMLLAQRSDVGEPL